MGGARIVGRDAVLAAAWTALHERGIVLLTGAAGIGKTAVLRDIVARARADGYLVLGCAPTEAETALPLAAIADLLQPLTGYAHLLPEPQRAAVDAALLLGDAPVDERALAAATRTLLDEAIATAHGRVLLAIDDAPWLDPPSERALRFVLRRKPDIGVLVGSRIGPGEPAPLGLDAVPDPLTRFTLDPLGVGPLHHLISQRFDVALGRPLLARVAHESGGNPLLAIELTRAVLRLPVLPSPGDDLPVVASMQDLVAASVAALPDPSRTAVRLAALLSTPTVHDLIAAGTDAGALDAAEEAGLLTVGADDRIRFAHPTHAAAVRAGIPGTARRRLHALLAGVLDDPDEQARHLARATTAPDEHVATLIAAAAARARSHGAPEVAAGLYDRAAELTVDAAALEARRLAATHCRFDAGDYVEAGRQADEMAGRLSGDERADALLLRAAIAWSADDIVLAERAATTALESATPGSTIAGRIHAHLAVFADENPAAAGAHAEAARTLLARSDRTSGSAHRGVLGQDDRSMLASALMSLFFNEVRAGLPARIDVLDEALALEGDEPSWLAGTIPAIFWKAIDEHDRARTRLAWMYERAVSLGDEPFQHELLTHLADLELYAGRFAEATRWTALARELGEQLASGLVAETWLEGMVDVVVGNVDTAAASAAVELDLAAESSDAWRRRLSLLLAGTAALAGARYADAAAAFATLADEADRAGLVEPLGSRYEADWVEACVLAGDVGAAEQAFDRLQARHDRLPRPWTALGLARGRVLLAAMSGDAPDGSIDVLLAARAAVPPSVVPLERARCLLVAGVAHRRAKRKRQARDVLTAAAAEFDALGARSFAARARAEQARIGGRPAAPLGLTATEERAAALAANGLTNRAIADALFVSPKTVEANLARVYRKLGIATRAELGAAMATRVNT